MFYFFFLNATSTTEIYTYGPTLSLHDALPICGIEPQPGNRKGEEPVARPPGRHDRPRLAAVPGDRPGGAEGIGHGHPDRDALTLQAAGQIVHQTGFAIQIGRAHV